VLAGAHRHDPGAREPAPELSWRDGIATDRDPLRAKPLHVRQGLLLGEALREDREQVLRAVQPGQAFEHPERVLPAAPDVGDVYEIDLLRRLPKRAQLGDLPPVEETVAVHQGTHLGSVVVGRPQVRFEVDVAPVERLGVADLAPVVGVDCEPPAVELVAAHVALDVASVEPVRQADLGRYPGCESRRKGSPFDPYAGCLLESEEVVLLVRERPIDVLRREVADGHASASR